MKYILCVILMAASCFAQADPSQPGPLPVVNTQYEFPGVLVPQIAYPVDLWATVWHPQDLSRGPYPLIVLLHGNHGICRQPGTLVDVGASPYPPLCAAGLVKSPNHLGYDYVASRLAGYGYIVVSISANAINIRANSIPERGRLMQEHLRHWASWNSPQGGFPFGTTFSGKVDLQNIGLMGHSRGGEGVRAAYEFNRSDGNEFGIKAIFEIGPVDFGRAGAAQPVFNADNAAWSVILPACDRDVADVQGMRVFDRARVIQETTNRSAKSQLYILGTNHNHYNSEWTPEDAFFRCIDYPVIINRPEQEQINMTYLMGFFRTYLGGEDFKYLFTGDQKPPAPIITPVLTSYTESPNDILLIDNFTDTKSPDVNMLGGSNTVTNVELTACSTATCNTPPPGAFFHDLVTFAGKLSWPGSGTETPQITMRLGEGSASRNVGDMNFLAFRVAAQFNPKNPLVGSQNFSVRLIDSAGAMSNAVAVADYRQIPYPTGSTYRRSVLNTIRIPLADFRTVDKSRITAVQLVFDKNREGALFLTDVHLSPR